MADTLRLDYLSEEEILKFATVFSLYDKDHNGTIKLNELGDVLQSLERNVSEIDLQDMINSVNANGKVTIALVDFLGMMAYNVNVQDLEKNIRSVIKTFDKDSTGFISVEDLHLVLSNFGRYRSEQEVKNMIEKADMNDKGQINYEDFLTKIKSNQLI